jgi:hypothetical protein
MINHHFSNNVQALSGSPSNPVSHNYDSSSLFWAEDNRFNFSNVTEHILIACTSIKSKAVGIDGLNISFIKVLLPAILPYLTYILNNRLTQSYFPSIWKHAKVIALSKKSTPCSVDDFRRISILPSMLKILEIMKNQITEYFNSEMLLNPFQSGFESGHSTTTAMVKVVDDISAALETGKIGLLVTIVFSKAFDSIS